MNTIRLFGSALTMAALIAIQPVFATEDSVATQTSTSEEVNEMSLTDEQIRAQTLQLVGAYDKHLTEGNWEEFAKLWADDGTLEFPFQPEGIGRVFKGPDEIVNYYKNATGKIEIGKVIKMDVHPGFDPEIAFMEVAIEGKIPSTGNEYKQEYVLVFHLKEGKLWRYREYWNPLITIDGFGSKSAWIEAFN